MNSPTHRSTAAHVLAVACPVTVVASLFKAICALMMLLSWPAMSSADMFEHLDIHGFGGWAYGRTDNLNAYMMGTEEGNYDYTNFSLNISATVSDKLRFHIQPYFLEDFNGEEVGLDYIFAEWQIANQHTLRLGKIRASFMLYNEIYDVGTLRPFFFLPQGAYTDYSAKAYKGIGFTGMLFSGSRWEVQYDIYAGRGELQPRRMFIAEIGTAAGGKQYIEGVGWVKTQFSAEDIMGGRVWVSTPIEGFGFGVSCYTARVLRMFEDVVTGISFKEDKTEERYTFTGMSVEYNRYSFLLRVEYVGETAPFERKLEFRDTGYVECAWRFWEYFQVAARYEFEDAREKNLNLPVHHRDYALGFNVWFTQNFVIKTSLHHVEGNNFAQPAQPDDYIEALFRDGFQKTTNFFLVGMQFSF